MARFAMGLLAGGRSARHQSGGQRYQCLRGPGPQGYCGDSDSLASHILFIEKQSPQQTEGKSDKNELEVRRKAMSRSVKPMRKRSAKRDLFAELIEGMNALADAQHGKRTLTKIEAVYEQGIIRPLQPLELPEGTRLDLIVITHEQSKTNGNAAEIFVEITALPLEGSSDGCAGREHDSILYPRKYD